MKDAHITIFGLFVNLLFVSRRAHCSYLLTFFAFAFALKSEFKIHFFVEKKSRIIKQKRM